VLGQTAGAVLGLGLQLAAVASINGYGRDLEREADAGGMAMLVKAGYHPGEAPRVFELMRAESGDRGPLETFFFGSHPRLSERVEATRELLRTTYAAAAASPDTVRDTEEFGLRMRPVVRDNAHEDIRAGRFALARAQLDRVLALAPEDAVAHLYYGDLHRLRSQRAVDPAEREALARQALERYEQAAILDPALAEPHRQLGFLHYQRKDAVQAQAAFARYLALRPDAADAPGESGSTSPSSIAEAAGPP
jgi:beta-barrel assembly-enhancing protease